MPSLPLPEPLPSTIDPEVVASTPTRVSRDAAQKEQDEAEGPSNENEPPPNSQSSTKENDAPKDITAVRPAAPVLGASRSAPPAQQPPDAVETQAGTLPPDLLSLYTSSTRMLEYDFAHSPPYTIQRLAELVLRPKKHYRFLPSYLRALDRIVSVSSPVSDFPLPALHAPANGSFLTNGDIPTNGLVGREELGSDESLGGALLTPIPWLRHSSFSSSSQSSTQGDGEIHSESTETIEGPHGAGSIETVSVTVNGVPSVSSASHTTPPAPSSPTLSEQSDASSSSSSGGAATTDAQLREQGAVTQGELLRQEQEAGVVPLSQSSPRRSLIAGGAAAVGREPAITGMPGAAAAEPGFESEEQPHARGPEEITVEDMGPQPGATTRTGGLDLEAAVGRGRSVSPQPPDNPAPAAEADAEKARQDDSGAPGKDPQDVDKDVEMVKERMVEEKEDEAKDADGDVVVADADGVEAGPDGRED